MTEITRKPATISATLAGVAGVVAVAAAGLASVPGLVAAAGGGVVLAAGLVRALRGSVDVGAALLFVGVVAGGLEGTSIGLTLLGTVAAVVAWDLGQGAIDLGEQLGREAKTVRLEAVHAVSSVLVGLISATAGYAVFVFAGGGQPVGAVVLLLLAACLVTIGLGSRRRRRV